MERGEGGEGRREGSISLLCTLDPITFLSKPQQSTDDVGCCGREVQQVHTRNSRSWYLVRWLGRQAGGGWMAFGLSGNWCPGNKQHTR